MDAEHAIFLIQIEETRFIRSESYSYLVGDTYLQNPSNVLYVVYVLVNIHVAPSGLIYMEQTENVSYL